MLLPDRQILRSHHAVFGAGASDNHNWIDSCRPYAFKNVDGSARVDLHRVQRPSIETVG